ncbi:GTP cyclohydrolase II [Pseudomonas sp. BN414]|uniref:GTP cyclohydrolase II n=1 Tax=unclassified Pseudomonas TaxID=196821 RepID=UPI00245847E5|nr:MULTISPECIES: GTP cyclohydrolase II [unclassified Pseudomonas]MDH4565512.1 GTP cyclohydrolase II [Pseudomonas sp. BN414]MDH4580838.1 GTP cyclohydrolase II [Pseudomonas sp. BN415]
MSLKYAVSTHLPTPFATFDIHGFEDLETGKEHVALTLGDVCSGEPVLCRVHSECLTGDALFSQRCDCGSQLNIALKLIAEEGRGILLYLRQEGRGIGLINKLRAYELQDQGADTVEANEQLGFGADMRNYLIGAQMLGHFGIEFVRLMTNNPRKVEALRRDGINIVERVKLQSELTPCNAHYLQTKATKLGHMLSHLKLK